MPYREALAWIHSIGRFGMNQGLQRIEALLGYLGDPHKKLKFLHIGGTNGKGSTAALAASVLQAAGYRTGLTLLLTWSSLPIVCLSMEKRFPKLT